MIILIIKNIKDLLDDMKDKRNNYKVVFNVTYTQTFLI